ncbi:hypothetical protein ABIB25_003068 [Nakamurella sp. UYEF19]|uniref:methylenetetrahydrofolate reductase n=1 Tax=Nakamurella sp. UYEF19 TaxID=1756392 RepID=UPI00339729B5
MDLVQRLSSGQGGFLLFAITPPKAATGAEDLRRIAESTLTRLRALNPDGVVLYDILEERDRNPAVRPFPFLPTLDPADYLTDYLSGWDKPAVVYRAVGKYSEPHLEAWMQRQSPERIATVLVGASSSRHPGLTSLERAHALRRQTQPDLIVGAVAIPERHAARGDEHRRMLDKQAAGCSFFISQVLYDADAAKNLLSDYRDECYSRGVAPRPIVLTLSVCGSLKTLEFLGWLGVQVPRWMQRDLQRSESTLDLSLEHSRAVGLDMLAYCRRLGVPVGLNVESVSSRRVEIEAATQLATGLRSALQG